MVDDHAVSISLAAVRVETGLAGSDDVESMVREYREYVTAEVLASEIAVGGEPVWNPHAAQTVDLDGLPVRVALTRVS